MFRVKICHYIIGLSSLPQKQDNYRHSLNLFQFEIHLIACFMLIVIRYYYKYYWYLQHNYVITGTKITIWEHFYHLLCLR